MELCSDTGEDTLVLFSSCSCTCVCVYVHGKGTVAVTHSNTHSCPYGQSKTHGSRASTASWIHTVFLWAPPAVLRLQTFNRKNTWRMRVFSCWDNSVFSFRWVSPVSLSTLHNHDSWWRSWTLQTVCLTCAFKKQMFTFCVNVIAYRVYICVCMCVVFVVCCLSFLFSNQSWWFVATGFSARWGFWHQLWKTLDKLASASASTTKGNWN